MARVNIYIARFLIYKANTLVVMYIIKCQGKPDQVKSVSFQPACVVSVSVGFLSKERPKNDGEQDFRFCPPRSLTRPIFRAVFDSRSSFSAPKPNGNADLVPRAFPLKNGWGEKGKALGTRLRKRLLRRLVLFNLIVKCIYNPKSALQESLGRGLPPMSITPKPV